jgi:hypothetical protein
MVGNSEESMVVVVREGDVAKFFYLTVVVGSRAVKQITGRGKLMMSYVL